MVLSEFPPCFQTELFHSRDERFLQVFAKFVQLYIDNLVQFAFHVTRKEVFILTLLLLNMPPRKEKKSTTDIASTTRDAMGPLDTTSQGVNGQGTSGIGHLRDDIAAMLNDLKSDINIKLDRVILNQQNLLDRLSIVENKQTEMETALTFTTDTVDQLQQDVDRTTGTVNEMTPLLDQISKRHEELESNVLQLEIYSRNFNLRFCGIPEKDNVSESPADICEKIMQILRDYFQLPDVKIENAHRIGKRNSTKPRHILVKFLFRPEKQVILSSARKAFHGTQFYLMQDLLTFS